MRGNGFVSAEDRRAREIPSVGQSVGDGFDFRLAETHAGHLHGCIWVDQKKRGDLGEAVGVGNRICGVVYQGGKCDAEIVGEIARGAGVVLRDSDKYDLVAAIYFVNCKNGNVNLQTGQETLKNAKTTGPR